MAKKVAETNGTTADAGAAAAVIDSVAKEVVAERKKPNARELHSAGLEDLDTDNMTSGFEGMEADDPVVEKKPKGKKKAKAEEAEPEGGEKAEPSELEKLAQEATGEAPKDDSEPEEAEAEEEAETEEEAPEGEETPEKAKVVEDAPEVKAAKGKLTEWKWANEKGELDLPKLVAHVEKTLGPAYEFAVRVDKLIGKHAALQAAYYAALEAEGQLTDEDAKKMLAEYRKKQADAAPKRAAMTQEEFDREFKRLWNSGQEDKALELRDEFKLGPKLAEIREANRIAEEKRLKEEAERKEAGAKAEREANANKQVAKLAKQIPSMLGVDGSGKVYFKNKTFQEHMSKILGPKDALAFDDVEEAAYVALRRMKMTKAKPPTPKKKSRPSRPLIANGLSRNRHQEAHLGELEVYSQEVDA